MAGFGEDNSFLEQKMLLESMFGGTVSADVISSVIESCDGNIHLAADVIMNFSDAMTAPKDTENTPKYTGHLDLKPGEISSVLNVDAPPFEFRPNIESTTGNLKQTTSTKLQLSTTETRELPNPETTTQPIATGPQEQLNVPENDQIPKNTRRQSPSVSDRESPKFPKQQSSTPTAFNQLPSSTNTQQTTTQVSSVSFSEAIRNSGALPKKPPDSKPETLSYTMKNIWRDQVGKIVHFHQKGTRLLLIMRGVPGSGKSYLARHIVEYTVGPSSQNYSYHIFSSDSYFMRRGVYQFDRNRLDEAHAMNQRNVYEATNVGVSPIIVDNTNTELWEMEPYIRDGVRNGYMIEFVEPNTRWARNAYELEKKTTHGVPRDKIRQMLDRYEKGLTPESAMKTLRLNYPSNLKPPVLRNIPPFCPPGSPRVSPKLPNNDVIEVTSDASNIEIICHDNPDNHVVRQNTVTNQVAEQDDSSNHMPNHEITQKTIIAAQQKIEQFEKVEQEWENGERWETTNEGEALPSQITVIESITLDPKPPRRFEIKETEKMIEVNKICDDDWTKFMPPWQDTTDLSSVSEPSLQVETKSIGIGFESGDHDNIIHNVCYGIPRDINEGIPLKQLKVAKVIALDKSTSTHDSDFLSKKDMCKNTDHHFRELRRMFKSVPRTALRDIFERCNYDVNWAVNIVLDSYPESQINLNTIVSEDEDEDPIEECNCLASYNIIPDLTTIADIPLPPESENIPQTVPTAQKKSKRENKLSENSLQLKRQIESNVTISESHYSQHYLDLRRRRENNFDAPVKSTSMPNNSNTEDAGPSQVSTVTIENAIGLPETQSKSYPPDLRDVAGPSNAQSDLQLLNEEPIDSDTESESTKSETEPLITVNFGREFIAKLDEFFGRKYFIYPDNIKPKFSCPLSVLQQLNAHWALSVATQMDDGSIQSEEMINQDEDFARQLVAKEQEMSDKGKEPEIPTLKEIMDMELAYSIYERGVAEWRNNEPQDLAAKLSREKLYNLFPDIGRDILSELLMAHNYDFKSTIESLIVSTGQTSWLEKEKGIEKFVMSKEMERKEKFMEDQKKQLDEEEWPYLSSPEKPVTLDTVNYYRAEAEKWLQCRNLNFEKARQYFAKNSSSAASFYSDIAALHTKKYEQASCMAAAYLMSYHLKNNPDNDVLDLHYLRVPEAMVNLDIFLDQIIRKLRANNIRSKEVWIITGKGNHSVGGPRIKPAAKNRLKERAIASQLINGGLLMSVLRPTDMLTSELTDNTS